MTGSSSWIVKERRLAIYIRDSFTCQYCGKDLRNATARQMGLDHLEDLVIGGGHKGANNKSHNLVTACASCNSARGAKVWTNYATGGAIDRISVSRNLPVNIKLAKSLLATGQKWSDR